MAEKLQPISDTEFEVLKVLGSTGRPPCGMVRLEHGGCRHLGRRVLVVCPLVVRNCS